MSMLKCQNRHHRQVDKIHKDSGFSLLEVSISLAIMGLIIGLGMPPLISVLNLGKVKTTEKHQDAVMTALAAYGLQHGHLPCPAKLNSPGYALTPCYQEDHIVGTIPYYTLGIPAHYAHDGFKRPMIYAVSAAIVDQSTGRKNIENFCSFKGDAKGKPNTTLTSLQVYNKDNQPVMISTVENFVAVVLVSGDKLPTEDLKPTAVFTDHPYSKDYPYVLKWASRDFLSSFYGQYSCPALRIRQKQENISLQIRSGGDFLPNTHASTHDQSGVNPPSTVSPDPRINTSTTTNSQSRVITPFVERGKKSNGTVNNSS